MAVVLAVVLGRGDDRRAQRVVEQVDRALGGRVPLAYWSHARFLDVAAEIPELAAWSEAMQCRYVPSDDRFDARPVS